MNAFNDKNELLRIEDMIRRGRSNQDIMIHMKALYSDMFLNAFRDYLKEKDKKPTVISGLSAAELVRGVEAKTRAQMQEEFEERMLREATITAAPSSLQEPAIRLTGMQMEGVVNYNIQADRVYIGVGCFAQSIKWDDLDQFIEELRFARCKARGMVKKND